MKKLFLLFTLAFMALSCEEAQDFIDEKGHGLVFLEGEMKACFDDNGDTKNYKFQADLAWSAEVSADWVEVDPTSGPAGENKIKIKVDKNKSDEKRTGYVDITLSNEKSYRIELEQLASGENLDDVTPSTSIPNNEIWYTSADGNIVEPCSAEYVEYEDIYSTFGANILSNAYDAERGCWVIKFDGDVTTIGYAAFYECSSLTSVTIPDGVTTIGDYAFSWCSSLTSVTIPDGVTIIGDWVFSKCYSLTSVTIGDSVTTIGEYAFYDCDCLTSVTIPDSVTTIGNHAFQYCSSLTSVTIGDSVTTIGIYAFYGCSSLTSVTIGDSVTTIEFGAFANCSSLREFNGKYASEDGRYLIIDGTLNSFAPAGLTEYTIPNSVTTIGEYAFYYCDCLTSVTIPDSVTTIGWSAFDGCSSLTSVTIPDSVTSIGYRAFFDCWRLTNVTIGDSVTEIGDSAFSGCSILTEFNGKFASEDGRCLIIVGTLNSFAPAGLTEYTIPDSVTTIGDYAFSWCSSLTSVTIPDGVTIIGDWVFSKCYSLTSVTIGDSVTTIGEYAFYDCDCLTSVTIPDSVTTIGNHAFQYCSSLTSVTIGDSVTTIGIYAFYGCSSLTSVYCKATTPPTGDSSMFSSNASGRKIYVPTESVEAYKSAYFWSEYADAIVGYEF